MSDREAIFAELRSLVSGDQQVIVLYRKGARYSTLFKTGAGWDFTAGTARFLVLKDAEARREPVMVLDSGLDERINHAADKAFRSALCIPVCRPWGVAALMFAESPQKPRAFTFHQLPAWMAVSERLAQTMPDTPPLPERPSLATIIPGLTGRMLAAMGAIFVLSIAVGLALRPLQPQNEPPSRPTSRVARLGPEAIAVSYLRAIDLGQFEVAYGFLSTALQQKVSRSDFENHLKAWVRTPKISTYLRSGTAQVLEVENQRARVQVVLPGSNAGLNWALIRQDQHWRLDVLPGK